MKPRILEDADDIAGEVVILAGIFIADIADDDNGEAVFLQAGRSRRECVADYCDKILVGVLVAGVLRVVGIDFKIKVRRATKQEVLAFRRDVLGHILPVVANILRREVFRAVGVNVHLFLSQFYPRESHTTGSRHKSEAGIPSEAIKRSPAVNPKPLAGDFRKHRVKDRHARRASLPVFFFHPFSGDGFKILAEVFGLRRALPRCGQVILV